MRRVLTYKINEYMKTDKETRIIEISSEKLTLLVLLRIFRVNAITDPNEIVDIKYRIEDTLSDDLKINIFLSSNFSL